MSLTLLIGCVALAMIIHELGHFVMARRCKVTASEISLGLGPILLCVKFRDVRFSLRLLPLGSFVRLNGTELEERSTQQRLSVHL